ncbi:MAG: dihydroorotase, partial [Synechococcaceae bacterium WB9_4xB_025]|nr:dihydroorotase [Synechococcaceae bacterium WB9_4xB_025]
MRQTLLLDPVRLLISRDREPNDGGAALIQDGVLVAFDDEARQQASTLGVAPDPRPRQILAPCLVDPHSVLDRPFSGPAETLLSLRHAAARAGYGQVALLPRANSWRDRVERLQGFAGEDSDVRVHLWGGFSIEGRGEQLSAHGDLLDQGA